MNAYIVAGGILVVWAVLVALLGMRGFPGGRGGQRIAIAITVVLFAAAVTSAIADQNKVGERRGPEIDKPGEGPESAKPGQPTDGGGQQAPSGGGADAAPKDEGEQKDRGKPTALTLTADPGGLLKFDKASLQANAGHVTITMTNPSAVPHNISLRGNGVDEQGKTVQGNGKSIVQADLQPGVSYEYYCSIPGHFQGGMKGTLSVK
jgi:plastocyanin